MQYWESVEDYCEYPNAYFAIKFLTGTLVVYKPFFVRMIWSVNQWI